MGFLFSPNTPIALAITSAATFLPRTIYSNFVLISVRTLAAAAAKAKGPPPPASSRILSQEEANAIKKSKRWSRIMPLITTKLDTPLFHQLFTPELKRFAAVFKENNYELRIAGGPVRDLLMGIQPSDVDFATTANPDQVKEMFAANGIRTYNKNGELHGTVTALMDDKESFEVTTLRVDVVCDGRRAEVKYTTDWELDAFRRDLTINSLFLDLDGTVYDYTGGVKDLRARRIVFVGDAVERLQEDYLRILRYFRFFGRIAAESDQHESACIEAIKKCREGMKNITGERIWMEMPRILVGRFAVPIMRCMLEECRLDEFLALPSNANLAEFQRVADANKVGGESGKLDLHPCTALSSLLHSTDDVERFHQRVKLSNAERRLCNFLVGTRDQARRIVEAGDERDALKFFKYYVHDTIRAEGDLKEMALRHCEQLLKYINAPVSLRQRFYDWRDGGLESFPVNGFDLKEAGVPGGKNMKRVLNYLHQLWKESDFAMSKEELLQHANDELPPVEESQDASATAASRGQKRRRPMQENLT